MTTGIYVFNYNILALATGQASYAVPASVTTGALTLTSHVFNMQNQDIFRNTGGIYWYSPSVWSSEGVLVARSALNVYGTPYNWNATASMNYGSSQYNIVAYENDYGVSAYTTDVTSNELYLGGYGTYGGSNWNNW